MGHAKLSPSASSRWLNCPGSVFLLDDLGNPDSSSFAADEGSVAHMVAEQCLTMDMEPQELIGIEFKEYPGIKVNQEMVNGVEYYISTIKELHKDTDQYGEVEKRCPLFYSIKEEGLSDFVNITKSGTLHIWDLKYGKGVKVSAKKNTQGIIYGISTYDELRDIFDINRVIIHIVQPRLNWVESETLSIGDIEYWRDDIQSGVDATEEPNAPYKAGEKACMWCAAKAVCPELARFNLELMKSDFDEIDSEDKPKSKTGVLSDKRIQSVVQNAGLINKWVTACRALIHHTIESGEGKRFPEYKLVTGRSARKFEDEEEAKKFLKGNFKLDEVMPRKMLTAPQSETLAKAAKKSARFFKKFNALVIKPKGSPTLAPIGDKREALVFDDFEEIDEEIDTDDLLS